MTFASRNLTLDAQSQQESHVKWTSLCIEPNAKSLKLFNPQSQPKMPSDTGVSQGSTSASGSATIWAAASAIRSNLRAPLPFQARGLLQLVFCCPALGR